MNDEKEGIGLPAQYANATYTDPENGEQQISAQGFINEQELDSCCRLASYSVGLQGSA